MSTTLFGRYWPTVSAALGRYVAAVSFAVCAKFPAVSAACAAVVDAAERISWPRDWSSSWLGYAPGISWLGVDAVGAGAVAVVPGRRFFSSKSWRVVGFIVVLAGVLVWAVYVEVVIGAVCAAPVSSAVAVCAAHSEAGVPGCALRGGMPDMVVMVAIKVVKNTEKSSKKRGWSWVVVKRKIVGSSGRGGQAI